MRNAVIGHGASAAAIVAVQLAIMFVGAILPTPLYPMYRQAFGFSGLMLTLIYAVYVLGNIAALLLFGRLADQIGRRSVNLVAIGCSIASAAAFATASGTSSLFVARALSGLSTGLAAGAATAWIADLYDDGGRGGAARIASAANFFGCAAGPLLGGLLAQFAVAPLQLPFLIYLAMLTVVAAAILLPPETVARPLPLRKASFKPRIGVPPRIRLQFLAPAVTGFATFSLIGFYAALIPNLLGDALHQSAPVVAGAVVCELFAIAAVVILVTGRLASESTMLGALALLPPSVWVLVVAEILHSLPLLLLAAALGGIAGGLGYRGSLEVINHIAAPHQRSEVVSSYMIALFAGNSLPVIGIGLVAAVAGSLVAHVVLAAVISVLAAVAAFTGLKYAPNAHFD